jgi:hypothetical protein
VKTTVDVVEARGSLTKYFFAFSCKQLDLVESRHNIGFPLVVAMRDREPKCFYFNELPNIGNVTQVIFANGGNAKTSLSDCLNEALHDQSGETLPNRRSANSVALDQVSNDKFFAGREGAGQDVTLEERRGLLGKGVRHSGVVLLARFR